MEIFAKNDAYIKESNLNEERSFTMKHNRFSTMTKDEYKRMLGKKPAKVQSNNTVELPTQNLTENVDWRAKGGVNKI